jgi:hypothetical protein
VTSLSLRDRKALIIKCQIALFSAYRVDQFADPEGFKNSLGAVLEGFPDEVIMYVCDPRTGLQRRLKWPPTISEVVEACEDHIDRLKRLRTERRAAIVRPYEKPQARPIMVFVTPDHPQYGKLVEWAKTAPDGSWMYWKADQREGMRVLPDALVELGMMRKGAA